MSEEVEYAASGQAGKMTSLTETEEQAIIAIAAVGNDTGKQNALIVNAAAQGQAGVLGTLTNELGFDLRPALVYAVETNEPNAVKALMSPGIIKDFVDGAFVTAAELNNVEMMKLLKNYVSFFGLTTAADAAGRSGASATMQFIADELAAEWKNSNPQSETRTTYYLALKGSFDAAAAAGHPETAAVALRALVTNHFPQPPVRARRNEHVHPGMVPK